MIHHLSISALNPQHVAEVLAEIWHGKAMPFPPNPGSYVVLPLDEYGTMIEIYPTGTEMHPGNGSEEVVFAQAQKFSAYTATHAAISVPSSQSLIEQIATREGWRCVRCDRGGLFEVIELWIENCLLLELLPPALAPRYLNFMQPDNLAKAFASAQPEPVAVS